MLKKFSAKKQLNIKRKSIEVKQIEEKKVTKDSNTFLNEALNDSFKENELNSKEKIKFNISTPEESLSLLKEVKTEILTKKLSQTIKTFDSSIKLSENPFDILKNETFKITEKKTEEKPSKRSLTTDEQLLSRLKRPKNEKSEVKNILKEGVFKTVKILSKNEISIPQKKYYKFPFEMSLNNDESEIFLKLRATFTSAFASVYANYRKFGESFVVVIFNDICVFSKELKCTLGMLKILKSNDILFEEKDDCIHIDNNDKALVYDIIMNMEIPKGKSLPFILSEYEFDNGIVYRTKLNKGSIVKASHGIEYSYSLEGPLYSTHFNLDPESIIDYF